MLVKFAVSDYAPNIIGDWGVQPLFQDSTGQTIEGVEDVVAIRATSFNVIPEIPILGAAGASLAMLAGFAFTVKRQIPKVTTNVNHLCQKEPVSQKRFFSFSCSLSTQTLTKPFGKTEINVLHRE